MSRTFKLDIKLLHPLRQSPRIANGKLPVNGGSYHGKSPLQAAKKAFGRLARKSQGNRKTVSYRFAIRETGTSKRLFYVGTRTRLAKPIMVMRGGVEYPIRYKTTVRRK